MQCSDRFRAAVKANLLPLELDVDAGATSGFQFQQAVPAPPCFPSGRACAASALSPTVRSLLSPSRPIRHGVLGSGRRRHVCSLWPHRAQSPSSMARTTPPPVGWPG